MDENQFKNGHWTWDNENNTVQFISHEIQERESAGSITRAITQSGPKKQEFTSIRFKETIENIDRLQFRRHFQRRVRLHVPEFIIIQDVKDVALFLANKKDLTPEFIKYFHLPEVDKFLKAMIIYFHFFLQMWDNNLLRRIEASRKLRQPIVTKLENVVRDDLSDIRAIVGREYCAIIMGNGKVAPFHHLATGSSLSEKDRRLFEALICMTVRVVWIALQRRYLNLIDLEINQMFRSDHFNVIAHRSRLHKNVRRSSLEERIILGGMQFKESKLKQRSFPCKDLLYGDHDYRILGTGLKTFEHTSERTIYFEGLFAAPPDQLLKLGHTIGLVGCPRDEYDPLLYPRERTPENWDLPVQDPIKIVLPHCEHVDAASMPKKYPTKPSQYKETMYINRSRKEQCRTWCKFQSPKMKKSIESSSFSSRSDTTKGETQPTEEKEKKKSYR